MKSKNLRPAEPGALYPRFLGGKRRCPPEDCGGIPGYFEFLKNIAGKQNKKRKAALDWYGGPYDPDEIGEQKIVAALNRIQIRVIAHGEIRGTDFGKVEGLPWLR